MEVRSVRVAGHFGEFLQGLLGPSGPVALVTLPCPALAATARRGGADALDPAMRARLVAALNAADDPNIGVSVEMPPGAGAGASTSSLIALARALGAEAAAIPAACLAAEGAVDPTMLPRPAEALWASREARVIETLPSPPAFEVVGAFFGAPERTTADDGEFPDIADLIPLWRAACDADDLRKVAALASLSAERTTAMRGPKGDPVSALAEKLGALGWARAHTGSARALLFAPGAAPDGAEDAMRGAGGSQAIRFRTP